jgi:hypothetical protein
MQSPFFHYNTCFDPVALIEKFRCKQPNASPSHVVNFLGLKINPEFMPECVRHLRGQVEPPPNPANWHSDISEFGAVLRAIDLASGPRFVMAELGCGWGCWMGIAGLAAKTRHFKVSLIGVEGDTKHLGWAKENMLGNGFSEEEYRLVHGIAAAKQGKALFPRNSPNSLHYGLEPVFNASRQAVEQAKTNNTHEILEMVPLREVFSRDKKADLLHIDIQGGEVDLVKGSLDYLSNHVAYMVIGTHSRVIEGQLIDLLTEQGWILEIERPAIFHTIKHKLVTAVDGVQGWRNLELLPYPEVVSARCGKKPLRPKYSNWFEEETTHRWSEGNRSSISFELETGDENCTRLSLNGFSNGEQRIALKLNGKPIHSSRLSGAMESLEMALPTGTLKSGKNILEFELPDARHPGNGDPRILGFALKSLKIAS